MQWKNAFCNLNDLTSFDMVIAINAMYLGINILSRAPDQTADLQFGNDNKINTIQFK